MADSPHNLELEVLTRSDRVLDRDHVTGRHDLIEDERKQDGQRLIGRLRGLRRRAALLGRATVATGWGREPGGPVLPRRAAAQLTPDPPGGIGQGVGVLDERTGPYRGHHERQAGDQTAGPVTDRDGDRVHPVLQIAVGDRVAELAHRLELLAQFIRVSGAANDPRGRGLVQERQDRPPAGAAHQRMAGADRELNADQSRRRHSALGMRTPIEYENIHINNNQAA